MAELAPWWRPEIFARRRPILEARNRIRRGVRGWFEDAGFTEVETPALQVSPGNETHISAFETAIVGPDGAASPMFLHSSPEFACKKLLAAGVERPYALTPVFRNRERGRLHHPEFLMLEWYRAGGTLDDLADDVAGLFSVTSGAIGENRLRHRGASCDMTAGVEWLSVTEAFRRHAGLDLAAMLPDLSGGFEAMAAAAGNLGVRVASDDGWSDLFSKILSVRVEPNLGLGRPTVLFRYPASEAALARLCDDDPRFAQRFEVYACGVELANAFAELTDAGEQRRRFEAAEAERRRIYGAAYPFDEDFLAALEAMPPAAGIALGFDRLVMLATGAEHIEDVLWTPVAEPRA